MGRSGIVLRCPLSTYTVQGMVESISSGPCGPVRPTGSPSPVTQIAIGPWPMFRDRIVIEVCPLFLTKTVHGSGFYNFNGTETVKQKHVAACSGRRFRAQRPHREGLLAEVSRGNRAVFIIEDGLVSSAFVDAWLKAGNSVAAFVTADRKFLASSRAKPSGMCSPLSTCQREITVRAIPGRLTGRRLSYGV